MPHNHKYITSNILHLQAFLFLKFQMYEYWMYYKESERLQKYKDNIRLFHINKYNKWY